MIFVCGDTHRKTHLEKLNFKNWPQGRELTKDDYLIVLGDFGLVWFMERTKDDSRLENWFASRPWTTLFIDGNHENFDRLFSDEFPEITMFESRVKKILDSIFYLQRGHIYNISGKTFFTFGGGESVDKLLRLTNVSWWSQELPNYSEIDLAIDVLKLHEKKIDFILTHVCSEYAFNELMKLTDFSYKKDVDRTLRSFFTWIENNIDYKQWHFGHYHNDFQIDNKHFLHFENSPMRIV